MNSSKIFLTSLIIIAATAILTSCYRDKEDLLYGSDCSNPSIQEGVKFAKVDSIITNYCVSCHSPSGGYSPDLSTKCSIVQRWSAINTECIVKQTMPEGEPLSTADQQAITDWINAGHEYTN